MKKLLLGIGIILLLIILGIVFLLRFEVQNDPLSLEGTTYKIPFDGEEREFNVHTPLGYNPEIKYPLVLVLHGGGGRWLSAKKGSRMNEVSDLNKFIVVYPNSNSNKTWNVGARGSDSRESDSNDILYLKEVISFVSDKYNVDSERVFATGLSNGGMMSYRLACDLPGEIKAVAPVAGSLMFHPCEPTRAISIMAINGVIDPIVPYNGGSSAGVADNLRPASESIGFFVNKFCPSQVPKVTFKNNDTNCVTYTNCQDGAEYSFCTIANGGHTWPGGVYESGLFFYPNLVGPISQDMFSAQVIYNFFSKIN